MGTMDLPKTESEKKDAAVRSYPAAAVPERPEQVAWVLHEEINKLIHHIDSLLPAELVAQCREQLYDTLQENCRNVLKRCWAALAAGNDEDGLSRYSPQAIADLLYNSGGAGKFNSGEIEKPAPDTLETHTNTLLRSTAASGGVSAFLQGDAACTIVKCAFMDNPLKPQTVTDVQLAVNVLDSALIKPYFCDYALIRYLVGDLLCKEIIAGLTAAQQTEAPGDTAALLDRIAGICCALDISAFPVRERIEKLADIEDIRNRGFDAAVHTLAVLLDGAKMPYQFIEYRKNGRELVIREYESAENLPDERYRIQLRYLDRTRLAEERAAYDEEVKRFEYDVRQLWDLLEVIYQDSKSIFKVHDYEDLVRKNKSRIQTLLGKKTSPYEGVAAEKARAAIARMHERMRNMRALVNPRERAVMEERLAWLEKECDRVGRMINPHQLRAGLLVDIELGSIKRKKTTLDSMAAVLREFLGRLGGGFEETALAVFGAPLQEPHAEAQRHGHKEKKKAGTRD